jgi:rubredoxin
MSTEKFKCRSCGYVYDPESGDLMTGIAPGTPFEDLPDGWICPLCGVRKTEFFEISE